jgi:hypothetical protein
MDQNDPFAWPAKAWSLSANEYKFWRGSKDLFFTWCGDHAFDWLCEPDNMVPAHGDLHMGNIGTYASDAGFGSLAFGMVDFDDAARLPFQIELLQGFITLRLMAHESGIEYDTATDTTIINAYCAALSRERNATSLLADDAQVRRMLSASDGVAYSKELNKFCEGSRFRSVVKNGKGEVTDVLRPVDEPQFDAFAAAIASACGNCDAMSMKMRATTPEYLRKRIKAVAERTRLGSSGSQGLKKYLVLLDRPFAGIDSDVILYLKQEIPTAAERSSYLPADPRKPGQRTKETMDELVAPKSFVNSWATMNKQSFWVSVKEPWSDEFPDRVKDADELLHAAKVWGAVAGSALRDPARKRSVIAKLDDDLARLLAERADAYVELQRESFRAFSTDPRTLAMREQVSAAMKQLAQ